MIDKKVCSRCIGDPALSQFVEDHGDPGCCSYCESDALQNMVISLEEVTDYMRERVYEEWTDPVEELPYESREGGYQGETLSAWDLLPELEYDPENVTLYEDIVSSFSDQDWCRRDYFTMREDERLKSGWSSFAKVVQHARRFTFWTMGDPHGESEHHPDYTPVGTFLDEIGRVVSDLGLIREYSADARIYRVRVHKESEKVTHPSHLASPPVEYATQANRMSPDGIPMFYGAEDFDTACLETLEPDRLDRKHVSWGQFKPLSPLRILDVCDLPHMPSFWDSATNSARNSLNFLYRFRAEVSKPIERGIRHRIEYVPTQAFTEYVRHQMNLHTDKPIDGIRYPSSRNARPCVVLFVENEQCYKQPGYTSKPQVVELVPGSISTMPAIQISRQVSERQQELTDISSESDSLFE